MPTLRCTTQNVWYCSEVIEHRMHCHCWTARPAPSSTHMPRQKKNPLNNNQWHDQRTLLQTRPRANPIRHWGRPGSPWFDLIWFGLIWFDLSRFDLIWFDMIWVIWLISIKTPPFKIRHWGRPGSPWFDLIWFDLIWFDLSRFDLIWFDMIWVIWLISISILIWFDARGWELNRFNLNLI